MRVWERAEALELSRILFVNMLDRERADFFRTLGHLQQQLSDRCVAIQLPIGAEHELTGIVDLLHNCAYMDPSGAREGDPVEIPAEMADVAAEYREKLLDAVVETDEALMERYLGGEELDPTRLAAALKTAVTNDELYPVAAASRRRTSARTRCSTCSSRACPRRREAVADRHRRRDRGVRLQDRGRPVRRPDLVFPGLRRHVASDSTLVNQRDKAKERLGQPDGASGEGARARRRVRRRRYRRGREAQGRADRRRARRRRARPRAAAARVPGARDELRGHAEDEGRRGQGRAGAAAAARGGSDARSSAATRRPASSSFGYEPGARRGRGRPAQEPLRRRGRAAPAARPVRRDDQGEARAQGRTRSRPAAAASSATATS